MDHQRRVRACEGRLRRAGLPLLIEDYSATEDIFTRAVPFLTLVALLEVSSAVNLDWGPVANVLAVFGGLFLVLASYGIFNRLSRRPWTALPARVSLRELALFVLLPPVLPVVFGGQLLSAVTLAAGNLFLLGLVWLVVGFGLFSIMRWAGTRLFSQLTASFTLLTRALPLILFFGLLAFFSAEIWQLFGFVPVSRYVTAVALFLAVGLLFLLARLPQGVGEIESTVDLAGVPLRRPQRVNLGLVILVSQALQILLVTGLVWLFFSVFGALLVDVSVIEAWTGAPPEVLFTVSWLGDGSEVAVTRELLRAALGIGAFSGLYYTVGMYVDATYRDEFVNELTDQIRNTFKVRAEYLDLLDVRPVTDSAA